MADNRVKITLRCDECKQRNYNTVKNKKNTSEKLDIRLETDGKVRYTVPQKITAKRSQKRKMHRRYLRFSLR